MFGKVAKLEKAYSQNPDAPLFARLADLYLHRGMVYRALSLCEEGCERFPDYTTGHMILSKCYEAQDKMEEARMTLARALRLDPVNPGGFVRLSRIYQELGTPALALESLRQAARLDPFNEDLSEQVEELLGEEAEEMEQADVQEPPVTAEEVAAASEGRPAEAMVAEPESYETASSALDAGLEELESPPDEDFDQTQPLPEREEQKAEQPQAEQPQEASQTEPDDGLTADRLEESEAADYSAPDDVSFSEEEKRGEPLPDQEDQAEQPPGPEETPVAAPEEESLAEHQRQERTSPSGLPLRNDAELINLFQEIETQQRQNPSPAMSPSSDSPLEELDGQIATETLAEIYSSQGLVQRAIETYKQILEQQPENEEIRHKLTYLEQHMEK
jgi:tetratricopeptide (TPR) repeat protein